MNKKQKKLIECFDGVFSDRNGLNQYVHPISFSQKFKELLVFIPDIGFIAEFIRDFLNPGQLAFLGDLHKRYHRSHQFS